MNSTEELQDIMNKTGKFEQACSCESCKAMCMSTPCLGTPSDILKIAEAGHANRLSPVMWTAGVSVGIPVMLMVQPMYDENKKSCTFLNSEGLCELHDSGLKPTEGKLSTHVPVHAKHYSGYHVAMTWLRDYNMPVAEKIMNLIDKALKK